MAAHTVRPVDPMLMTNLVYPDNLVLSSLGLMDPWAAQQRDLLQTGLRCAAVPLQAYREEYHRFLDFFNLDVADYVRCGNPKTRLEKKSQKYTILIRFFF